MNIRRAMALGMVMMLAFWAAQPAQAMPCINVGMSFKVLAVPAAPEPASLGLLAVGSAALLLRRHRR